MKQPLVIPKRKGPIRPEAYRETSEDDEPEELGYFRHMTAKDLFIRMGQRDSSLRNISGANVWKAMEKGKLWVRHTFHGPKRVLLFFQRPTDLFPRGQLSWGQDRMFPDGTLDLKQLTNVWLGCKKGNFSSSGLSSSVDPTRCVTLVGRNAFTLDLEAPSRSVLAMWMFGLNHALSSSTKDAVLAVDIKNARMMGVGRFGGMGGSSSSNSIGGGAGAGFGGGFVSSPLFESRRTSLDSALEQKSKSAFDTFNLNGSDSSTSAAGGNNSFGDGASSGRGRRSSVERRGSFSGALSPKVVSAPTPVGDLPPIVIDLGPPPPEPQLGFLVPEDVLYSVHDPVALRRNFEGGFMLSRCYLYGSGNSTVSESVVVSYDLDSDSLVMRSVDNNNPSVAQEAKISSAASNAHGLSGTDNVLSIPISAIDQLIHGKATQEFSTSDTSALNPTVCLTILSGDQVWNLVASTAAMMNNWLSALNMVCSEHKPKLLIYDDPNLPEGNVLKSFWIVSETVVDAARQLDRIPKFVAYTAGAVKMSPAQRIKMLVDGVSLLRAARPQRVAETYDTDEEDVLSRRVVLWLVMDPAKPANAALHWADFPAAKRISLPEDSLPLSQLKTVWGGKKSSVLRHQDCANYPTEHCFSLVPANGAEPLDLICEAPSGANSRPSVLAALDELVRQSRKRQLFGALDPALQVAKPDPSLIGRDGLPKVFVLELNPLPAADKENNNNKNSNSKRS